MRSFLNLRKPQFGLLLTYGMTPMQLRKLVFLENMLIGLCGTVAGIGIGFAFVKVILLIAENVLDLDYRLLYYFPAQPLLLTVAAFIPLFAFLSLLTFTTIGQEQLRVLLKGNRSEPSEPRTSRPLARSGVIMLLAGYGIAIIPMDMASTYRIVVGFMLTAIGTYLIFDRSSVAIVDACKRKRRFFWRNSNLLLLSDLARRMKNNAKTQFMASVLFTVALTMICVMFGWKAMITNQIVRESPFPLVYASYTGNMKEAQHLADIRQELVNREISYQQITAMVKEQQPSSGSTTIKILPVSGFNAIARAVGNPTLTMTEGEAIRVVERGFADEQGVTGGVHLKGTNGSRMILRTTDLEHGYMFPDYGSYLVVTDDDFGRLYDDRRVTFYLYQVADWKQTEELSRDLKEKFGMQGDGTSYTFFSLTYTLGKIKQIYGGSLFAGFFIGGVFLAAAGSFLYFRQYAADKREHQRLRQLSGGVCGRISHRSFPLYKTISEQVLRCL